MKTDDEKLLICKGEALGSSEVPTIILGMTPAAFEFMREGLTHTVDLRKVGIPVKLLLFRGEAHEAMTGAMMLAASATEAPLYDLRGTGRTLPDLGIDEPVKQ